MDGREISNFGHGSAEERVLVVDDDGLLADGLAALVRGFGMNARRAGPAEVEDVAGSFRPTVLVVSSAQVRLATAGPTDRSNGEAPARILWLDADVDASEELSRSSEALTRITADLDPAHFRALLSGDSYETDTEAGGARAVQPTRSTHDERLIAGLTVRERSVLEELASGRTNGAIAQRLSVSPNTVRTHVQNIFHKLDVRSRLEAVALAVGAGLLSADTDARA